MNGESDINLGTVAKIVLFTAGAIYLMSLLSWFAHWMIVLGAVGGAGYVAYRVGQSLGSDTARPDRQLTHERSFEDELARLESEERQVDVELGL